MTNLPAPAYEKLKAHIRARIASGEWKPGDAVPSEAELTRAFGVSRMTAHRALRELAAEGLVTRLRGSGTRVAVLHPISSRLSIRDIHEEIAERGHQHSARVLLAGAERARAQVAKSLAMARGARVFHVMLVHLEDGVPIQLEDRYVNPAAAPDFLDVDFTQTTPTRHLLACAPLTEASYCLEATWPCAEEARALVIPRREPCLVMTRRTLSGKVVASLARLVYPGSRHRFAGQFQVGERASD